MYRKAFSIKKVVIAFVCAVILGGVGYRFWLAHHPTIYTFDKARDMQSLLGIVQQNWNMLFFGKNYSPEFIFTYLAPSHDARYFGKLKVNVLRQGAEVMGFVAYYMKSVDQGFLLFLAIDSKYRRHGYGERLLKHGLRQLSCMGAKKIQILTKLTNIPARTLYERVGFYEISRNEDHDSIYFEYDTKEE